MEQGNRMTLIFLEFSHRPISMNRPNGEREIIRLRQIGLWKKD